MITLILVIIFVLAATFESISYGYYEIKINKNKLGGITLIVLSLIGLVFSFIMYGIR